MIRCFYPLSRLYSSSSRIFCKIRCRRWLTADCVMPYRRAGAAGAARENRKKTKRNLKTHLLRFPVLLGLLYDSANVSLFSCSYLTPKSASVAPLAKLSFLSSLLPHTLLGAFPYFLICENPSGVFPMSFRVLHTSYFKKEIVAILPLSMFWLHTYTA